MGLALFVRGGSLFAGDGDPGRHIRVGSVILESGQIPRVDLFSHTMRGEPFVPYEWLSEVIYALAHDVAGLSGVALLAGLLFAGAVFLTYRITLVLGVGRLVAFGFGLLALFLQASHLHPRPHLFTTLFTALTYLVLLSYRRGDRPTVLLWLPPVFLVWANTHGGFLVGFILLAFFLGDAAWAAWRSTESESSRRFRILLLASAGCLAVTLINPAGLQLWPHTTGYLKLEYLVDTTQEYQSPDFHGVLGKVFLAAIVLGIGALMARRRRADLLGGALFITWVAFALHSARNIALFAVVAVPWIGVWIVDAVSDAEDLAVDLRRRISLWSEGIGRIDASLRPQLLTTAAVLLLAGIALGPSHRGEYRFSETRFPVAAVAGLPELPVEGNVFNEFHWGGYLLYAAYPEVPVFIDGQTDFYGEDLTKDYNRIRAIKPGWQELLSRYRIGWTLLPPDVPLSAALSLHDGWVQLYQDSTAVIFGRRP